jgi:hypothetical protein
MLHLTRRQLFELPTNGGPIKKFFTMGGARSHGIADGAVEADRESNLVRRAEALERLR